MKRLVKEQPFGDFDHDGVPNIYDCDPLNPKRHGIEPNEEAWKRIEALPIFVTDEPIDPIAGRSMPQITRVMRGAEHDGSIARQRFLSIIKHYPQVLGEIERQKPVRVIVTSRLKKELYRGKPLYTLGYAAPIKEGVYDGLVVSSPRRGYIVVRLGGKPYAKKFETRYGQRELQEYVNTFLHELAHLEQYKKWGVGTVLAKRMRKGVYTKRPLEKKAEEVAEKKLELDIGYVAPIRYLSAYTEGEQYPVWKQERKVWSGFRKMFK